MLKKLYLSLTLLTAFLWLGSGTMWGDELTVHDGTSTTLYAPVYGYYGDNYIRTQIIYPAESVMSGNDITSMTFYMSSKGSKALTSEFQIRLCEVTDATFSSTSWKDVSGATLVYEGTLDCHTTTTMTITFQTPYSYSGGNLLFDLQSKTKGSYTSSTTPNFLGENVNGSTYNFLYKYNSTSIASMMTGTAGYKLPKVTFVYEAAASCKKPTGLTKGAVTTTSATFTWTAGGSETSWQWICLPAATAVDWSSPAVQTATSATATATGLNAETNYKFYVRANCGSEQSAEVSKAFTTPCAGASLPFEQNFDGEATNTIPSCWAKFAYVNGDYSYPFVYSGGVTGNCMYFYGGGATSSQTIILPPLAEPTNTLLLSFSYKNNQTGASYGQTKIGYVTDPEDVSTFVALAGGSLTRTTSWTEVKKFALTGAPANSYIAIQLSGGSYSSQKLYLDDIKVTLPSSCADPTGVSAAATAYNQASVSWTEAGSATAWNIQYSTDNFATHTDVNNVTENPYTLTGLTANTTYKVRVQANCGSEQSDWVVSEAFETPCEPTTGIGWTADFAGASTGSSAGLPSCWVKNSTNSYPYIYQYGARSNSRCLYFSAGSGVKPIAVLPPFNESTNTLFVTLWYNNAYDYGDYCSESHGQLEIGFMTNPADASTFTAQEVLPRVCTYTQAKVALTNAPEGSRVAIRYVGGSTTGYAFVDDIAITAIPSCVAPSGVAGSATDVDEASISWTANGSETAWKIKYSSDNGETWSDEIAADANPFTLTGLSAQTTYIAQVKADCGGGEYSEWSASSLPFSTPCVAKTLPYAFDFESAEGAVNAAFPTSACWSRISSSSYPQVYNSGAKSGSQHLRFYGSGTQYAVLPQFAEDVKGMTMSFYYSNYSWGGTLSVGYMTDPTDASTFVELSALPAIYSYGEDPTELNLSAAAVGANYIAFKYVGTESYHYSYIDNIVVEKTLSCQKPTEVVASNMTSTTADIAWTENNSATAWKVQYSTDGTNWTDANGGEEITSNPYTLTGLTPNHTAYYARVKSVCGGGDGESNWSAASDPFQTECETRSMPFSENFNGLTEGIPTCWDNSEGTTTTPSYKWNYYATGHEGKGVRFDSYNNSGNNTNTLKTPAITISEAAMLVFWYKNPAGGDLSIYYSIDGVKQDAPLASGLTGKSEWTQASFNLPNACVGHDVVIMFQGTSNYGNGDAYIYLDDVQVIEQPACPAVNATTLAVSDVTANSATVAWTAASEETAWNLQYKAEDGEWSSVIPVETTPSYELTGLAANKLYYVKVQANCGDGTSAWTGDDAFSFRTDCEAIAVSKSSPWNYGFEDTNDGFMPSCWERTEPYANYGYPVVVEYSYYAQSGTKYLNLRTPGRSGSSYTEDAILPVFNTEIKNLKVSFVYFNNSTGANYGQLAIGYVVGDAFTQVGDLLAKVDDYTSIEREMPNDAPDGARIAIRCIGSTKSGYSTYAYVDDVVVSLKPTCYTPTALAAAETSDGAVLTWTAGKDESEWSVRYSVKDADEWTVVDEEIAANNYTLTGLSQNVTYEVQVKAVCGVGDESEWSASAEFEPVCNAPTALAVTARTANSATFSWTSSENAWVLQYSTDGESWENANVAVNPFTLNGLAAGQAYQAKIQSACGSAFSNVVSFTTWCAAIGDLPMNEDFENVAINALPACWEKISDGDYPSVVQGSASYEGENGKCLCFFGVGTQIAVMPAFSVELDEYTLSFFYKNANATLELGYINNAGEFVSLQALDAQSAYGDDAYQFALSNELTNKNLAIRYVGTNSMSSKAYLDVVRISKSLVLADNVNNSALLAANEGQTLDVQIGRSIVCADYFNTICLPFDLPTLAGTPLEGGDLWAFKYAKVENDELLFRIIESDHIEAGKPYFISFPAGESIDSPIFKNVTIAATTGQKVGSGDVAQLCGIIDQPVVFEPNDKTKLFLAANNTLYWWAGTANSQLNNFRAYFKVATSGADAPARHGMRARIIKQEETATGIENVKFDAQTLKLVENGNVIIIRNGVKYNIQGQVISK